MAIPVFDQAKTQDEQTVPQDVLLDRFGTSQFYLDNIDHREPQAFFRTLQSPESRTNGKYELARQYFLKLFGRQKARWLATSRKTDQHVYIVRIHKGRGEFSHEYIAFMQIEPKGHRGKRQVPHYMRLNFHLLTGRAMLVNNKKPKHMLRGSHCIIESETDFYIKCVGDQTAVFVFNLVINKDLIRADEMMRAPKSESPVCPPKRTDDFK